LEKLSFVTKTCAITLHPVETDAFGVKALQRFSSTFIAFEPGAFLDMTRLTWIQGDEKTARRRLEEGGAIIVAREFQVARGLGVGDTFTCRSGDKEFTFDIVGVITSPGLDIVSRFFAIGDQYTEQSLHAVFGSRKDLIEKFKSDQINLIQVGLKQKGEPGYVDDGEAVDTIKRALFSAGILDAGSGRQVKEDIIGIVKGALLVSSSIALFSMVISGFGVANLIIAGIHARQFEFGVLRAVGAQAGQVARLVVGEAVIIAIAAMVLGTCMGFQGAFAGRRLDKALLGLEFSFVPPYGAIAAGWGIVLLMTLGAALPAVVALARKLPRDLLGAMKG
jgi:putative ABC transport system permease protein